ncbi:MAG: hypothetical protein AAGI07_10810 [Bacteroidota bacterium]
MKNSFFILLVICLPVRLLAQQVSVPFDSKRWHTKGAEYSLENYKGKESIFLEKGHIYLEDVDFLNGTIEVDINFPQHRAFHGISFRLQDDNNYEDFYIRPHQSGNPDANQYTPVFNGFAGWQLYYGAAYAVPIKYEFNEWHTVKIVVLNKQAQIYFDNMEEPVLHIEELKRDVKGGKIGVRTFVGPVHFANFRYTLHEPELKSDDIEIATLSENVIQNWQVSNSFPEKLVGELVTLPKSFKEKLSWQDVKVTSEGHVNLAKYASTKKTDNTVISAIDIESEEEQIKKINFGFSDKVKVYLNDQLLYEGNDTFVSRDYRFLGTVGFYDALYLPLKKGKNTLYFAVNERMGGWAVQAKFENMEGISLTQ